MVIQVKNLIDCLYIKLMPCLPLSWRQSTIYTNDVALFRHFADVYSNVVTLCVAGYSVEIFSFCYSYKGCWRQKQTSNCIYSHVRYQFQILEIIIQHCSNSVMRSLTKLRPTISSYYSVCSGYLTVKSSRKVPIARYVEPYLGTKIDKYVTFALVQCHIDVAIRKN